MTAIHCSLCGELISKYEMDLSQISHTQIDNKFICYHCSKQIATQIIEDW